MELIVPPDLPRLQPRAADSHKGDFGRALLVGGSRGMAGAIAMSGMAALRGGAGLVKLAVPDVCLETVAQFDPCYMTVPLDCDPEGRIAASALEQLHDLCEAATCIAVGPGLGRSGDLTRLVGWLYRTLPQPLVIDADGLNALAESPGGLEQPGGPRVLTPHPGEFARLVPEHLRDACRQSQQRTEIAAELAGTHGIVIVLKGHNTLVTNGSQSIINSTGNPGLATGGTGDVLTGLVTALICQRLSPSDAARLGVYLHGLAGDLAAAARGQVAMTARDVIDHLPEAIRMVNGEW